MKSTLRFLLFLVWVISFSIFVFTFSVSKTVLSESYIKEKLVKKDFYNHLHSATPAIAGYFQAEGEDSGDLNNVTPEQLGRIIAGATSPNIMQAKTEQLISEIFVWMYSESTQAPSIKISDIKTALMSSQASVLEVPQELLESGDFGVKFPDKIDVPVPKALKNSKFIINNKNTLIYGSLVVAALAFSGFVLLKKGGLGQKLHSAGEALFWTGLVAGLFFGSFWGFFTASGTLAKGITGRLKLPQTEVSYFYSLISDIITGYTIQLETFCIIILVLGFVLWVSSKFMFKRTIPVTSNLKEEAVA